MLTYYDRVRRALASILTTDPKTAKVRDDITRRLDNGRQPTRNEVTFISKYASLPCEVCGRTGIYRVGLLGYCFRHKAEAVRAPGLRKRNQEHDRRSADIARGAVAR